MAFWLRDLPAVMRGNGWTTGAACMDHWFRTPGRIMSLNEKNGRVDYRTVPANFIDTQLVTMAWAVRFKRVRDVAATLQTGWLTPRAIDLLRSRLQRAGLLVRGTRAGHARFGDLAAPTIAINASCQVNSAPVGGVFDPFDDFYAALGRATMNIAVTGVLHVDGTGGAKLVVDELGLYLRDSYEFIGDQDLGVWNRGGVSTFAVNTADVSVTAEGAADGDWSVGIGSVRATVERHYRVSNRSFTDYRTAHHMGGDFTIFTDLLRVPLSSRPVEVPL